MKVYVDLFFHVWCSCACRWGMWISSTLQYLQAIVQTLRNGKHSLNSPEKLANLGPPSGQDPPTSSLATMLAEDYRSPSFDPLHCRLYLHFNNAHDALLWCIVQFYVINLQPSNLQNFEGRRMKRWRGRSYHDLNTLFNPDAANFACWSEEVDSYLCAPYHCFDRHIQYLKYSTSHLAFLICNFVGLSSLPKNCLACRVAALRVA